MGEKIGKKIRIWTNEETKALLACYAARRAEFEHPRKKKYAMQNVLEDLISQNVLLQPTTVECLQVKIKNLLRAYKSAKDGNSLTGASPIALPFEEEMDDIFGNQPNIANSHTINLGIGPISPIPVIDNRSSSPSPTSSVSFFSPETPSPTTSFAINQAPSTSILSSQSPSPSPTQTPAKRFCKSNWYREKIQYLKSKEEMGEKLAERAEKAKQERFNEFMGMKKKQHEEKMDILKNLINKDGLGQLKE